MNRKHKADQFHFRFGREDFRLISETCDNHERVAREQAQSERDRKQSELNQLTLSSVESEDQ